jgi:hypothetical protein
MEIREPKTGARGCLLRRQVQYCAILLVPHLAKEHEIQAQGAVSERCKRPLCREGTSTGGGNQQIRRRCKSGQTPMEGAVVVRP